LPDTAPTGDQPATVRVVLGPHHPVGAADLITADPWTVGPASNRVGVRLARPGRPPRPHDTAVPSFGMVTGAVQLPPDGNPIILGPDHATVGGYPVVACVIAADLPRVGQLQPGDQVIFVICDVATARHAYLHQEHLLSERVVGWFPTETAL
jgi:allophanate hydrolase